MARPQGRSCNSVAAFPLISYLQQTERPPLSGLPECCYAAFGFFFVALLTWACEGIPRTTPLFLGRGGPVRFWRRRLGAALARGCTEIRSSSVKTSLIGFGSIPLSHLMMKSYTFLGILNVYFMLSLRREYLISLRSVSALGNRISPGSLRARQLAVGHCPACLLTSCGLMSIVTSWIGGFLAIELFESLLEDGAKARPVLLADLVHVRFEQVLERAFDGVDVLLYCRGDAGCVALA